MIESFRESLVAKVCKDSLLKETRTIEASIKIPKNGVICFLQSLAIYYFYLTFCCGWCLTAVMYAGLRENTNSDNISYAFLVRSISGAIGASLEPSVQDLCVKRLSDYGGINLKMIVTILVLATTQFMIPLIPNIYFTLFFIGVEGCVYGLSLCAVTIYLSYIWGKTVPMILHALHIMSGMAGTIFPLYCSVVMRSDISETWKIRLPYFTQSVLLMSSSIPFMFFQIKPLDIRITTQKKKKFKFSFKILLQAKTIILVGLTIALHFGHTVTYLNRGALTYYLVKSGITDQAGAAVFYSGFFASMMIVRIMLVPLSNFFSSYQILSFAYSFGLWSVLLIWFFGRYSILAVWIGVVFQGLCSSPTYSPYFVISDEEFQFKVPNVWVSIFTYAAFLSVGYPSLGIKLIDIHPDTFMILLLSLFTFDFMWNFVVVCGGKVLMYKICKAKKKEESVIYDVEV